MSNVYGIKVQIAGFAVAALSAALWISAQDGPASQAAGPENGAKFFGLVAVLMVLGPLFTGWNDER